MPATGRPRFNRQRGNLFEVDDSWNILQPKSNDMRLMEDILDQVRPWNFKVMSNQDSNIVDLPGLYERCCFGEDLTLLFVDPDNPERSG